MGATRIFSKGEARKFAYKLTSKLFKIISTGVFRTAKYIFLNAFNFWYEYLLYLILSSILIFPQKSREEGTDAWLVLCQRP
jgi:hypothetical protein